MPRRPSSSSKSRDRDPAASRKRRSLHSRAGRAGRAFERSIIASPRQSRASRATSGPGGSRAAAGPSCRARSAPETGGRGASGEQGIVGFDRADADHDRIHSPAQLVDQGAGGLRRDPAAIPGRRRRLAVQCHRPFGRDERHARDHPLQVRGIEQTGRLGFAADLDQ